MFNELYHKLTSFFLKNKMEAKIDGAFKSAEEIYLSSIDFYEDNDLVSIWEDDYYASGYNADELDDEEEGLRAGFIGFLDIFDQKYIRFNGYGDSVEFGCKNPAIDHPDWSSWC